jgi:ribonuclease-3
MTTLKQLQKTLGHRFRRKTWIEAALTHPSFRNEREAEAAADNQRLEFLGDAVIGLLVADHLFRNSEEWNEGTMTQLRSAVTSREALARIGVEWNLGNLMRFGEGETRSGGATRESNLADAVEAVIGAVYREGGLKACRPLFQRHFLPRLEELQPESSPVLREGNPKGALQEWTQAEWKCSPRYEVVEQSGPAHERNYVCAVILGEEELARGRGGSKRVAEAEAAAQALVQLQARVARSSSTDGISS